MSPASTRPSRARCSRGRRSEYRLGRARSVCVVQERSVCSESDPCGFGLSALGFGLSSTVYGQSDMHRIIARRARDSSAPRVDRDPAIVSSFLSDAAHVAGGSAAGVAFPRNEAEVAALVTHAERVLPIGAQSSLTGGATPRGEIVLSTRALSSVGPVTVVGPVLSDGLIEIRRSALAPECHSPRCRRR
jgi:hypothetical protein